MRAVAAVAAIGLVACTRHHPLSALPERAGQVLARTREGYIFDVTVGVEAGQTVLRDRRGLPLPLDVVVEVVEKRRWLGALHGLGWGVLGGAAAGAVLGYASGDDDCNTSRGEDMCYYAFTAGENAVFLGAFFGILGGLGGLIYGAGTGAKDVYRAEPGTAPRVMPSGPPGSVAGMTVQF